MIRMKTIFFLCAMAGCFVAAPSLFAQDRSPMGQERGMRDLRWYNQYEQALNAAKNQNKPLLLFFTGSNWCGWCKKMEQEVFSSPEFISQVGSRFIFVKVDFPTDRRLPEEEARQNEMLKKRFKITGYPTLILLDPSGKVIAQAGYRPGGGRAYAEFLQQYLR